MMKICKAIQNLSVADFYKINIIIKCVSVQGYIYIAFSSSMGPFA